MSAIPAHLRQVVAARAEHRCEYCHLPQRGQVGTFPVDHILPRTAGGVTEEYNLALACPHCNAHKWAHFTDVDPVSGETVSLFNPRTQLWSAHFRWSSQNRDVLEGITPPGRATVFRLLMNHPQMIVIRQLLRAIGLEIE